MLYVRQGVIGQECQLVRKTVWLLSVIAGIACLEASADPVAPAVPTPTKWVSGPSTVALGSMAEFKIPEGYEFTSAEGARTILEQQGNPAPKGLLGLVKPQAGGWLALLEFAEIGHVKGAPQAQLDSAAILKQLWSRVDQKNETRVRAGQAPISSLNWQMAPAYDPAHQTVSWAIRAESRPSVVNQTVCLLGRRGMIELIGMRPGVAMDLEPLKQIAQNVSFKKGETFADYQSGDKLASLSLADVVCYDSTETPAAARTAASPFTSLWMILAAVVVGIGCLAVAGAALVKNLRSRKPVAEAQTQASTTAPILAKTPAPVVVNKAFSINPSALNGSARHSTAARPAPKPGTVKPVRSARFVNGSQRKRMMFDYNRYFTDLMSSVSSHALAVDTYQPSGGPSAHVAAEEPAPRVNGHAPAPVAAKEVQLEMLLNQKTLIEDQRRLIHEQSKLIEEKTRLIAEKNQLLKMQSQLLNDHLV
jgi:uncharacterized membrane-anchored protein